MITGLSDVKMIVIKTLKYSKLKTFIFVGEGS